jgi:DNA-binding transcriptional MerR regulator
MNAETETPAPDSLKMAALATESGISKELIHHYLRAGLLPRPRERGLYGARHVRLLRIVKRLRDERFLPLPIIREIVTFNEHDPDRIELVLLSGSEMTATAGRAAEPAASENERLSIAEIEARTGADKDYISRCAESGLIRPVGANGDERFTPQDANVVSLVARGMAMGIPFESFRTIRSYVEIAFELERSTFLPRALSRPDLGELAREFAVRKEIVTGFLSNVLTSLINSHLHAFIAETAREARVPEGAVYRPSEAFRKKHGIDRAIERLGVERGRAPRDARLLVRLLRLLYCAGKFREVVFAVEQGRAILSKNVEAERLLGYGLVLSGESARGTEILTAAREKYPKDAVTVAYLAAARFQELGAMARVERALARIEEVTRLAAEALGLAKAAAPIEAAEARAVSGWLLTSLPAECEMTARGLDALEAVFAAGAEAGRTALAPAVARIRYRVLGAFLLQRALRRGDIPRAARRNAAARREALAREVYCLDPACDLARVLYLGAREEKPRRH